MHLLIPKLCSIAVAMLARASLAVTAEQLDAMTPVGDTSNCDKVSKYNINLDFVSPESFFINGFENSICRMPTQSDCLFYGKGLGGQARPRAAATGQITIWDIWGEKYYSIVNVQSNTLRCIMYEKYQREAYFAAMSASMGALCDVYAQYMTADVNAPDMEGFFGQYEYPQMKVNGAFGRRVDRIDAISAIPYATNENTFFIRGQIGKRDNDTASMFDEDDSIFNSTVFQGLRERAAILQRDGCGATEEDRKALDDCSVIPW